MLKVTLLAVLAAQLILHGQGCEKASFTDVEVKASKYFTLADDPDDIKLGEMFTGCLTGEIEELKNALQIVINHQKVNTLEAGAIEGLEYLHSVKLQNNEIEVIKPGAFVNLLSLSMVDLSHNKIEEIFHGVFNDLTVKRLLLNDNRISKIDPKAFDDMPNLVRIDLDRNSLKDWNSDWFTNSPNIFYLSASHNQITELPAGAFKNIKGKHSTLEKSGVRYILTSLHLNNNEIAKINPTAFEGVKELDFLDLAFNKLDAIEEGTFSGFERINNLFLNHNNIRCLPGNVLSQMPTTELVDLNDNPIECECLNEMKLWSKTHSANFRMTSRRYQCIQERIRHTLDSVKDIN